MLDYQIKLLEAKIRGVKVNELFVIKEGFNTEQKELLESHIAKLESGYPLDYLLGEIQILGLRLKLNENVLIPRPETEEWLLEFGKSKLHPQLEWGSPTTKNFNQSKKYRHPELVSGSPTTENGSPIKINQNLLVDLGCGSGVIGLYLAQYYNQVYALDISPKALEIGKQNAGSNEIKNVKFFLSDGLSSLSFREAVEEFLLASQANWTLVANLPYLPQKDKLDEDEHKVKHEPDLALYSGDDGLDLFRKVLMELESFNTKPTQVIFELDPRNISIAKGQLENVEYETLIWVDSGGHDRVLIGNYNKTSLRVDPQYPIGMHRTLTTKKTLESVVVDPETSSG